MDIRKKSGDMTGPAFLMIEKMMRVTVNKMLPLRFLRLIVGLIFLLLVIQISFLFGQAKKCASDNNDNVKYKIAQNFKGELPPFARSLRIVVKPENFNRDYMTRLGTALHQRFCTDDEISAIIFDDMNVANTMDMGLFAMGRIKVPEVRGFYTFTSHATSEKGKEQSIEYSTIRGNPTNEVVVNLPPN